MLVLTHRHLKLFFKNPYAILLSLASSFVILSLYFLFIRDFMIVAIHDMQIDNSYVTQFVDELMISGLLIVINATSMLSILSIFINDKSKNIIKDFLIAPLHKVKIYYSYILACIICSMFISFFVFLCTHLCLSYYYETFYTISYCTHILIILFISSLIASHLLFLAAFFISSITSFSNIANLFGVLIGFCTGVYIPISYYPAIIRNATFLFPLSQTTSIIRQFSTQDTLSSLTKAYPNEVKDTLSSVFGIRLEWRNMMISQSQQLLILFLSFLILFILTILICCKSKK
ncbi:MAG: ABC transporter permease [Bacilli bacterium]|nr:ABC transporter permease [Bacilli bacterium]